MRRRTFLKAGAAAVTSRLLPFTQAAGEAAGPLVWEAEGPPADSVPALFSALGGLGKLLGKDPSGATVLIKPNLCLPHPSDGTATSPEAIEGLCAFLIASGVKRVVIADHTLQSSRENLPLRQAVERHPGAKLLLANEQRFYQPVEVSGKALKRTELLKAARQADLFINFPTAKHHSSTDVSLATKNLMGVIWDRTEFHTRLDLAQAIADLALVARPGLNIVDCTRVLLNGGPTGPGPILRDSRLFASADLLAVDAVVASRYRFGGKSLAATRVAHLRAAHENGVGEIDLRKIRVEKVA